MADFRRLDHNEYGRFAETLSADEAINPRARRTAETCLSGAGEPAGAAPLHPSGPFDSEFLLQGSGEGALHGVLSEFHSRRHLVESGATLGAVHRDQHLLFWAAALADGLRGGLSATPFTLVFCASETMRDVELDR